MRQFIIDYLKQTIVSLQIKCVIIINALNWTIYLVCKSYDQNLPSKILLHIK